MRGRLRPDGVVAACSACGPGRGGFAFGPVWARKGTSMPRTTIKQIMAVIKQSSGLLSVAANRLNMPLEKLERRVNETYRLSRAVTDAYEITADFAEAKLFEALRNGAPWAIKLFLQTKASHRGYAKAGKPKHWLENLTEAQLIAYERRYKIEPLPWPDVPPLDDESQQGTETSPADAQAEADASRTEQGEAPEVPRAK